MIRYLVVIEKTDSGFSCYAPDLPGCAATGSTRDILEKNMYEAIQLHLEGLAGEGLEIPEARAESEVFVLK